MTVYLLQKLRHTESDRLSVQVHAYVDNMIDVAALLEDSETKTEAIEKAAELEDELSQVGSVGGARVHFTSLAHSWWTIM